MKFADGFWLNKRGYEVNYAAQAYEITPVENGLNVYVPTQYIQNRGQTLGGPCLDITFTSTQRNVIKVSIVHYKGGLDNMPKFELNEDQGFKPEVVEKDDCWELISGDTKLVLGKNSWSAQYYYKDKRLTGGAWRSATIVNESEFLKAARLDATRDSTFWDYPRYEKSTYIRDQLSMNVGEYFYGFGEKFTPFVKNGQTVETWNSDGGTCSDQSYKCIPFYVSSEGYGVLVNSSDKVSFEVCSDTVSKVSFTVAGERLEYFVIGGENVAEVLQNYTDLTGKPALPPAFTFGLWLTTSFTTNYDEETVTSFIDGMAERDIPLEVFHFDSFWMKEFQWCDLEWDKRQFPDPPAMLSRLKAKGLKTCVWLNPYIGQRSPLFDEGVKGGFLLKNPDGSIFQCDMWQPGLAIVDFTNPAACEWYASKLRRLCEMGIDAFKTDFGERIPTNVKYFNGADPIAMHNYYTYIYNKTVFNVLKEYYGENKACLFARSATVGGQKFPVHWGGDCSAEYTSMAETIRGGLSLCISGFGYFSHDISGFEATATPDIYKRWAAFGLLSSHSRLHGNNSYRVPWLFDDEAVDVLRHFTKLKGRLMPYLWAQAIKTHTTGVPMMRAMVIDYNNDPACLTLDKQYMFGDNLLVAPICNERGDGEFYLPEGKWTDILNGKVYEGGRFYREKYDYFGLPCLAKPNSIIAYGDFKRGFEYDYLENAEFVIYQPEEGKEIVCDVFNTDAEKVFTLKAVRRGNTVEVTFNKTDKPFAVKLAGGESVSVQAGSTSVSLSV
ncbi:MAG: alpha-xylosidase [Lachnospiraceae bacterium]|nr:alpha-xylosidase [Ruminococcus sp.]MCM1275129.1 alpha-xylosidase [Lachnospiraceae bacterium]